MKKSLLITLILCCFQAIFYAQDSSKIKSEVIVRSYTNGKFIPDSVYQFKIVSGKKVEVLVLNPLSYDLSTNNYRQLFKKTPGIYISEHDASGLQTSIAARGLSANRSWDFNMRQNGYDISADPSGYPEAYYTPTLDAVEKVEVFRGSSALQYGTQFGGMINYVFKDRINDKPIAFESTQTLGSFGLFNSYSALSGKLNRFSYYGSVHHRQALGFRQNSAYKTQNYFGKVSYAFKKGKISAEFSNGNYLSQQAGGIHDSLLTNHSDTSFRARNWFQLSNNVASIQAEFQIDPKTKMQWYSAYSFADRNSVGFLKAISIPDTINENLGTYNPRQVDIDNYRTLSSELRINQSYKIASKGQSLIAGVRFCQSEIDRMQQGVGTGGMEYNMSTTPDANGYSFPKEFQFSTMNLAVFMENLFNIGNRLSVAPGFRMESINSTMEGRSTAIASGILSPLSQQRMILLGGISSQLNILKTNHIKMNMYGNFVQNYRPALYSEMIPSSTTETVDSTLRDVNGHSAELGLKGNVICGMGHFSYDINTFYIRYNDKIGLVTVNGSPFKTNIGDVESKGFEFYGEWMVLNPFLRKSKSTEQLSLFVSGTIQDARYKTWNNPSIATNEHTSILGKKVEYAPEKVIRTGLNYQYKWFAVNYQYSFTSEVFTDAANTLLCNLNGTVGKIESYGVHDLSLICKVNDNYALKIGSNNLTNVVYATRRAGGYPGPGLLPSQGRSLFATLTIKI